MWHRRCICRQNEKWQSEKSQTARILLSRSWDGSAVARVSKEPFIDESAKSPMYKITIYQESKFSV